MVIETLEPLDKKRKSFRLMNGVLVERTVEEVLPTLRQNYTNVFGISVPFCVLELFQSLFFFISFYLDWPYTGALRADFPREEQGNQRLPAEAQSPRQYPSPVN